MHRSRDWKRRERKREKEKKLTNWHQNQKGQASATLILGPTAGNMTKEIKDVCKKTEQFTGMRVAVKERSGDAIKHVAKAEPLKNKGCKNPEECFCCSTGEGRAGKMEQGTELGVKLATGLENSPCMKERWVGTHSRGVRAHVYPRTGG